jgi:AGZA family xanthine/uracil permease-like MFS transporter
MLSDAIGTIAGAAPPLDIDGATVLRHIPKIDWKDPTETIPALLTVLGIPLSYSIADGLVLEFIRYPLIELLSGSGRKANWLTYVLAVVLVVYFASVGSKMV